MSLTPLRFRRESDYDHVHDEEITVTIRGVRNYMTDCGRFIVSANSDGWGVCAFFNGPYDDEWMEYLCQIGLGGEYFKTRHEVVQTLTAALEMDGLMDAEDPMPVISLSPNYVPLSV